MADYDDLLMGPQTGRAPRNVGEGDDDDDLRAREVGEGDDDDDMTALKPDASVGKWAGERLEAPRREVAEGDDDDEMAARLGNRVGEGDDDDELTIGRDVGLEASDLEVDLTTDTAGVGQPTFELKGLDDVAFGVEPGTGDDGFDDGEGVPDDFGLT